MIKNIAYIIVFIIFAVIASMAITINNTSYEKKVIINELKTARPHYNDTLPETIFKKELGN
jgi:hypothetical protein